MSIEARRDVFQAIADPTRRQIIGLIVNKSMNLNAIADNFNISRPAISQHIKILTECGMIIIRQEGRERFCEAKLDALSEVSGWVEQYKKFWDSNLDSLDYYLTNIQTKNKSKTEKWNNNQEKKKG